MTDDRRNVVALVQSAKTTSGGLVQVVVIVAHKKCH